MTKTLVVCYSFTGNSKSIAEYVKDKLNADLLELEPLKPFSDDYDEVVNDWEDNDLERDVPIKDINVNLDDYSNIVLISCVWWYSLSPVMKKFLRSYDLSNKNIIVASVNAGWTGHSLDDYDALLNSNIKSKLNIVYGADSNNRHELKTSYKDIDKWIDTLK